MKHLTIHKHREPNYLRAYKAPAYKAADIYVPSYLRAYKTPSLQL
ncbi:unnamed protein product [marine sediment metagenome]|uniref:Uncharacterized protein n=1 Tax=marine sediment metagenome TaxID=412755 RepID=X1EV62_9ZZZZ